MKTILVDDHHHVVPFVLEATTSGDASQPASQVTVVHFDSHSDLLLPRSLDPSLLAPDGTSPFNPVDLVDALGIGDFWLPLAFAGRVARFVWVQPPWATDREFHQGRSYDIGVGILDRPDGSSVLRASLLHPFYVDEFVWAPRETLRDVRSVRLDVLSTTGTLQQIQTPFILDIDLDFFSTNNPFKVQVEDVFGTEAWEQLERVYQARAGTIAAVSSLTGSAESAIRQHSVLSAALRTVAEVIIDADGDLIDDRTIARATRILSSSLDGVSGGEALAKQHVDLLVSMRKHILTMPSRTDSDGAEGEGGQWSGDYWDAEWIDTCGCMHDLPHRRSSRDDVDGMLRFLKAAIEHIVHKPILVTVARSVGDNFTPADQVGYLQDSVLKLVQASYGPLDIEQMY